MSVMLKLTVDQVSTAVLLLDREEKEELAQRLPTILTITPEALEDTGWLHLAESAFQFWEDPIEDLYNDLIPVNGNEN